MNYFENSQAFSGLDYQSPFDQQGDPGDEFKNEYLYNLHIETKKLIDAIKSKVDANSKSAYFDFVDYLKQKATIMDFVTVPIHNPKPPDITTFFPHTGKYGYIATINTSDGPENYKLEMDIIFNDIPGEVNFAEPYTNINFKPEEEVLEFTIAFNYAQDLPGLNFAIKLVFDDFRQFAIMLNFLNTRFALNQRSYDVFEANFEAALDKADGLPDVIDWLYEIAPKAILYKRDITKLIRDLKTIIEKSDAINERDTNEERAVLNILESFVAADQFATAIIPNQKIMEEAIVKAVIPKGTARKQPPPRTKEQFEKLLDAMAVVTDGKTLFERIYHALDDVWGDDNFTAFIILTYKYWMLSSYSQTEDKVPYNGAPEIFHYDGRKILGFYTSSFRFVFEGQYIKVFIKDNSFHWEDLIVSPIFGVTRYEYFATYHIFQPITLAKADVKGELKIPSRTIPAFFLKAFEQKNSVANLEKAVWLTVDIVTTVSGVGNLLKLRHLRHLSKLGRAVRILIAGTEVLSGTLSTILHFVNECKEGSLCDKLRTYLFWLDIGSLGTDLLTKRLLQKAARDAEKELRASRNIFGAETDDVLEHLDGVASGRRIHQISEPEYLKILDDLGSGARPRTYPHLLSLEEEASLVFYTTNKGYKDFNRALRGEIKMTDDFVRQKELMNRALDKLPVSVHNQPGTLVYRIENLTEAEIKQTYRVGETITMKHFFSTTYSERAIMQAMEYRPYTVLIRVEGKNGRLIENLSTLSSEQEILFKADSKFHVKEIGFEMNPLDPLDKPVKRVILIEK